MSKKPLVPAVPELDTSREKLEHLFDEFVKIMDEIDELVSVILKGHMFMEQTIDEIIELKLPKGYLMVKERILRFPQKVELLNALDVVKPEYIGCLRALNTLRNKCSHTQGVKLTRSDINPIASPLRKRLKQTSLDTRSNVDLAVGTLGILYAGLLSALI
jgi:hypothetical protein